MILWLQVTRGGLHGEVMGALTISAQDVGYERHARAVVGRCVALRITQASRAVLAVARALINEI